MDVEKMRLVLLYVSDKYQTSYMCIAVSNLHREQAAAIDE